MTRNLGAIKAASPSVLMRCSGEDLFYGCNFALMFPLLPLSRHVALGNLNRGPLLSTPFSSSQCITRSSSLGWIARFLKASISQCKLEPALWITNFSISQRRIDVFVQQISFFLLFFLSLFFDSFCL